jgi:hypothetical protein
MATYLIKSEKTITRQEGDTADIVMVVPAALDMDLYPDVIFLVVNSDAETVFQKDTIESTPTITVIDQTITIPLLDTDTKGYAGEHRWELQVADFSTPDIRTIGRGDFIINAEIITQDNA